MRFNSWWRPRSLFATCALALLATATAQAAQPTQPDDWKFEASVYGFFPDITGEVTFPPTGASNSATVDFEKILDNLQFTFMGSFEFRKNKWGLYTDFIYLDVAGTQSQSRDFSLGNIGIPANATANLDLELKGVVWTIASSYRAVEKPAFTLDLLIGGRLLDIEPELNWQLAGNIGSVPLQDRAGQRSSELKNWDAIFGIKGRVAFGSKQQWIVPYELDMGTGDSEFTWQAQAGLGYSFRWGDIVAAWRYLDYEFDDRPISNLNFSGPAAAVNFRW